ncbi:cyclic-di-AMP-binding protein CbpB [Secundilactobacillus folii]|uniref:CBS domain-containing protein n=1 Tax=Secundilactobacillus folii TaxID=2678357 RepID=A0A7X2XX66_9LACO|nr:cyclic-di-AMP-binding protein CbpB [Secundilactobacillus folii]MTV83238.1 CBS domain-containing protein [Secundilactobacillus folii]
MIDEPIKKMILADHDNLIIPANLVANVMVSNDCYHAFLVLTKVGYSKVPVLDRDQHLCGLISLSMITEHMLDLNHVAPENLRRLKVQDVMQTDFRSIEDPTDLEEIMHLLIDENFVPVVSDEQTFTGIITRRELLKRVNYLAHNFSEQYDVSEIRDSINES